MIDLACEWEYRPCGLCGDPLALTTDGVARWAMDPENFYCVTCQHPEFGIIGRILTKSLDRVLTKPLYDAPDDSDKSDFGNVDPAILEMFVSSRQEKLPPNWTAIAAEHPDGGWAIQVVFTGPGEATFADKVALSKATASCSCYWRRPDGSFYTIGTDGKIGGAGY